MVDKITIKQFREGSSDFWVDSCHYNLNKEGTIVFCAGGIDKQELRDVLLTYIKRNKKVFIPRLANVFETETKEYSIINYGKYSGKSTQHIVAEDKRYAKWIYENTQDIKIKEEIKELLKIK